MKHIQLNSKVSDKAPKVKFDLWTLVLAGRYGLPVVAVLMAVAYVSACFKAFSIATIAIALMLPITILIALYIAVSKEVDA